MVKVRANLGLLHLLLAIDQPQSRKVCKDRIAMTKQTGARMATQAGFGFHVIRNRAQIDQTCAAVAAKLDVKATNYLSHNVPQSRQN